MNTKKNISPAFKTIGTLGVFAGLCGIPGAVQAQLPSTQKQAPVAGNTTSKTAEGQTLKNKQATTEGNTLVVTANALPSLYLPETISDPKFTAPLADTTRTVTIIPEKVLQEQQATTLTDALKNSPGVGAFFSADKARGMQ